MSNKLKFLLVALLLVFSATTFCFRNVTLADTSGSAPVATHVADWEEVVTKSPTCTATGIKTIRCKVAGCTIHASTTETIPAKGHDYPGTYTKYSDTQHGKKCRVCGNFTDLRNHVLDRDDGWRADGTHHWKICVNCSAQFDKSPHTATSAGYVGHNAGGSHYKVCSTCMNRFDSKPHVESIAKSYNGYPQSLDIHYIVCNTCETVLRGEAHSYDASTPDHTCTFCGYKDTEQKYHWFTGYGKKCGHKLCSAVLEAEFDDPGIDPLPKYVDFMVAEHTGWEKPKPQGTLTATFNVAPYTTSARWYSSSNEVGSRNIYTSWSLCL